ncbi:MAG: hypothetical protein H3Z53_07110 [archaeon]|nr:hypothetical protein [archaeon]MCP8314122.1 hypothetical protein [archaeon]MCP8317793.1 hypothetical protein [archaeon]MCP8319555.1 hypothetical protein [archaeon]
MGHVFVSAKVKGAEKVKVLEKVMVDTGASYTVLPQDTVEEVKAWELPLTLDLELGDGRKVKAKTYAAVLNIEDREAATIFVSFEGAKPVIGVRSLEDLGLRVNPMTSKLEPTRPRGMAYFY